MRSRYTGEVMDNHGSAGLEDLSPRLASIAATYAVLSDKRAADEYDILIQTVLEAVSDRATTRDDLIGRVWSVWPGAPITVQQVDIAVAMAQQAGLAVESGGRLTLTMVGARDVERSRSWADRVAKETVVEIQKRASQALLLADETESTKWFGILTLAYPIASAHHNM
jgi:hypothetical protein